MGEAAHMRRPRWAELWRFYQAALVNTAFGFGLYAALITCGVNLYLAQAISFSAGVTFNYFMYSRHVFRDGTRDKGRFILAYIFNYGVNLALLAVLNLLIHNAYATGAGATLAASLINYFALKHLVFRRKVI